MSGLPISATNFDIYDAYEDFTGFYEVCSNRSGNHKALQRLTTTSFDSTLPRSDKSHTMAIFALRDLLFFCACAVTYCVYRYRRGSLVLPPGPTRWPIVGSALSIPFKSASVVYKELGERLGK